MLRRIFRRPSPGAVIALIALAVVAAPIAGAAQGPGATASKKKSKVVAHARLADNAKRLGGYRVSFLPKRSTIPVLGPDGKLSASVIPTSGSVKPGSAPGSPSGQQGQQGVPGPAGPSGFSGERLVFDTGTNVDNPNNAASKAAYCAANERIVGGGHEFTVNTPTPPSGSVNEVVISKPIAADGRTGWFVQMRNVAPAVVPDPATPSGFKAGPGPSGVTFKVWAVCVS